jgi:ribonuclease PH
MRGDKREPNQLRPLSFKRNYIRNLVGSVLVCCGNTYVICNASIEEKVPVFLRQKEQGWLTCEYSMLPAATNIRTRREATAGKQSGRTVEIQRFIGRSLRAAIDLKKIGKRTITIDCDVIQADGGTRCAAISGAFVALYDAIDSMLQKNIIKQNPINYFIAAVSVGIYKNNVILDLNYDEDCNAQTDMNIVMNDKGEYVEIQGTAEAQAFCYDELQQMLALGNIGIKQIITTQKQIFSLL